MATESELQDLHSEVKDQIGVLVARCEELDGDMPTDLKDVIMSECNNLRAHGLLILKAIDSELIRLKSLEPPPEL